MAFAFPRRANLVVFAVAAIACALEAGQLLVPGRDAVFSDACVKAMGGLSACSSPSRVMGRCGCCAAAGRGGCRAPAPRAA
jgi:hypothetical protein